MDGSICFTWRWLFTSGVLILVGMAPYSAIAQQVTFGTPLWVGSQSFVSAANVNFGLQFRSPGSEMFFRSGGYSAGLPASPIARFAPTDGWSLGVAGAKGGWSWGLGIQGIQGSSRQAASVTPMLTVPDGGFGFINSSLQRPFVTGIVPVVGSRQVVDAEFRRLQRHVFTQRFHQAMSVVNAKHQADDRAEQRLYREHQQRLASKQADATQGDVTPSRQMDEPLVLRPK